MQNALKREYGYAISSETSADEFFPVETIEDHS